MAELIIRPTAKFVRFGYTAVLVLVAAALAAASNTSAVPVWTAGVIALLLLWPAQRDVRRRFTKMTITGDKLRYESGFLSRSTRTIQLPKVQDVRVDQTLSQRLFGVGDLSIETAGETSKLTVPNIDSPQEVADRILEASHHQPGKGLGA